MAVGSYLLSNLTLDSSHTYVVLCMMLRNIGIAFATSPVTNIGMSSLDRKLVGNGSSVNNWVTQSIGCLSIGIFTSLLTFQAKQHAVDLVKTGDALKLSKELISDKSFVMGINDVYFISMVIVLIAVPICFLLKKSNPHEKKPVHVSSKVTAVE